MTSPIFSNSWYRVADLRPRLRQQARLVAHAYRGQRWHVMQDLASGRVLRFNVAAYRVLALMDGQHTLDGIWRSACEELGDEAPTQDEILGLLTQLHQANVLLTDRRPDLAELSERGQRVRRARWMQYLANPLSLRLPLLDPDPWVGAVVSRLPAGFWKPFLLLWSLLIAFGTSQVAMHWGELTRDLTARVFTSENVLILALIYPVLKLWHELGHAVAIKAQGGSCRELGLMFLVFVPIPYVDASQSVTLPDRWRRFLIGGAGMIAELGLASIAIWLWAGASEGLFKAMMHQVVFLAGVTTVVFNANPLLRFDGYYMLSDVLEIPNLGQRANQYFSYLARRYLFRIEARPPMHLTAREPFWLVGYALLSTFYRCAVTVGIIVLVAGHYFVFGVLMALWSAYGLLVQPLVKFLDFLAHDIGLEGRRTQAQTATAAMLLLVLAVGAWVPVPSWTMAEGIIWMPEQSRIRVPANCFGQRLLTQPGTEVRAGQALFSCSDPELQAQLAQAEAAVIEKERRLSLAAVSDRVQMQFADADLQQQRRQYEDLKARTESLVVRSPHRGSFDIEAPEDFAGRYFARGDVVAYVLDPAHYTLLTVVPQGSVTLVRERQTTVELRPAENLQRVLEARIVREVPAASNELPSMALALQGGGKIGLDPDASSRDNTPKAIESLFQFEMQFTGDAQPRFLGGRVHVRFLHRPEPLFTQWYRGLREQLIKRFAV